DHIKTQGECTAIALDIKGYFDNIDHIVLREKWRKLINDMLPTDQNRIYKVLTSYSYVNKDSLLKTFKGKKLRNEIQPASLFEIIPGDTTIEKFACLK